MNKNFHETRIAATININTIIEQIKSCTFQFCFQKFNLSLDLNT